MRKAHASRRLLAAAVLAALAVAVAGCAGGVARQDNDNNLKQLVLAMQNYNDTYRKLPGPATYDKDGKPLLSWRVALLPFVEEEKLYQDFHQDEPWDSEHNKALLGRMPKVYACPVRGRAGEPNSTFYQVFVGPGAAFEEHKEVRLPVDFPDGTAVTILIVEGAKAVPWTKPEDLVFNPDGPLPELGGAFPDTPMVAMADGEIRVLSKKGLGQKTLRAAITRNAGDVLGNDW
jgi:hypothetical protein